MKEIANEDTGHTEDFIYFNLLNFGDTPPEKWKWIEPCLYSHRGNFTILYRLIAIPTQDTKAFSCVYTYILKWWCLCMATIDVRSVWATIRNFNTYWSSRFCPILVLLDWIKWFVCVRSK